MSHIKIRGYIIDDEHFIYNSWLRSAQQDHPEMHKDKFFSSYKDHVTEMMQRNDIIVACDPDDDMFIHGYMVFKKVEDELIIHWAYVKNPFRKLGVFRSMIRSVFPKVYEEPIFITYKNDKRQKMYESLLMVFTPHYRSLKL